jgi:micrococcal nuclease
LRGQGVLDSVPFGVAVPTGMRVWRARRGREYAAGSGMHRRAMRPDGVSEAVGPPRRPLRGWERPVVAVLVALAALLAPVVAGAEVRLWGTVRAVAGKNLVVVSPDRGQIDVRLVGVELPEPPRIGSPGDVIEGQPFGPQAAAYLRELLLERQVQLDTYGKDRAGRLLSVVWLGEINVNLTLVKEGLAWLDPHFTVTNVRVALEIAERQAQIGKYGLWALPGPEPPWEYRKRHKLAPQ